MRENIYEILFVDYRDSAKVKGECKRFYCFAYNEKKAVSQFEDFREREGSKMFIVSSKNLRIVRNKNRFVFGYLC